MSARAAPIIGLTGGIGSGKSAVADLFARHGAAIVDTDAIAHELTAADGTAMPAIVDCFGASMQRADGALDRAAMRALVFAEPDARRRLEAILHPMIRTESLRRCRTANTPYVILAVPLLVESGAYRAHCARICVVDCPSELQVVRVMQRSGFSEADVRVIMASQASREARLAIADDIIDNSGSLAALETQVVALDARYRALAIEMEKE